MISGMKHNAIFLISLLFMVGAPLNSATAATERCQALSEELVPLYAEKAELANADNFAKFN